MSQNGKKIICHTDLVYEYVLKSIYKVTVSDFFKILYNIQNDNECDKLNLLTNNFSIEI